MTPFLDLNLLMSKTNVLVSNFRGPEVLALKFGTYIFIEGKVLHVTLLSDPSTLNTVMVTD